LIYSPEEEKLAHFGKWKKNAYFTADNINPISLMFLLFKT